MREVVIISLGGSVIVPDGIDADFLESFRKLVISFLGKYRFIVVVGGGKTARRYQEAGRQLGFKEEELDWIGINATWINAEIVRRMFRNYAYKEIVKDPIKKVNFENVLIAGGWKPGWSTDYDAVLLAEQFNSNEVINITNVDYLYDKNPNEFKDAKKIEKTDWKGFKKIVGDKWKPGTNAPFDPVATKKASELGLKLILIGKDIESLKNYLDGKKFKGSVVS